MIVTVWDEKNAYKKMYEEATKKASPEGRL